jgi:hypothetical protein
MGLFRLFTIASLADGPPSAGATQMSPLETVRCRSSPFRPRGEGLISPDRCDESESADA